MHTHARRGAVTLAIAVLLTSLLVGNALAFTEVGGHEIDADLETGTNANGSVDWAPNDGEAPGGTDPGTDTAIFDPSDDADETCPPTNAGRPGAVTDEANQATLICDSVSFPGNADTNIYSGGAKEDDPTSQTTTSSPVTPKTDLTHAYARGVIVPDDGDTMQDPGEGAWVIAAYEVIPKQGSYHTNVEFNQQVRCVANGAIVDGADECAGEVVPFRTDGDALLAVDIGGSNDPDQKIRLLAFVADDHDDDPDTDAVYSFGKNAAQTLAQAQFSATGSNNIDQAVAKVGLNGATIDCGPWGCFDDGYALVDQLPAESFVEVAFNLSSFSSSVCLNNVTFKSRASGQSVTSQLKDTTDEQPFPFCGGLDVRKYIDADEDGGTDTDEPADGVDDTPDSDSDLTSQAAIQAALTGAAGEFGSDTDLQGWAIDVYADDGDGVHDAGDTLVCDGTTDVDGVVSCAEGDGALEQLSPGTYHVVEATVPTGWQNTDPGGTSSPYVKTVEIGLGGTTTAWMGNTCTIAKVFEVDGVPSGTTGLLAWYDGDTSDDGLTPASVSYVALTPAEAGSSTWTGTATERFADGDSIEWGYGIDVDGDGDLEDAGDQTDIEGDETFDATTDGYPACVRTNEMDFAPPSLTIRKFKDITADGLTGDDVQKLGGWTFDVYRDGGDDVYGDPDDDGPDESDDVFVQQVTTATATGDGPPPTTLGEAVVTADLPIGTYHVVENDQANWTPTGSGPGDTDPLVETVVLALSDTKAVDFANAPEVSLDVTVTHPTTHTQTDSITCVKTAGTGASATAMTDTDTGTDSFDTGNVLVGTYQCTVVVSDP